jgi:toxin FitB
MLLLDTNVVSELRKVRVGRADPNVAKWSETLDIADLFISIVTIHELEIGVLLIERRDPLQGAVFREWLENHVMSAFDGRILPLDVAVARRAAKLHVPDPQPINDAFIAATALVHSMTIATRNLADFVPTGVPLLNPWDSSIINKRPIP